MKSLRLLSILFLCIVVLHGCKKEPETVLVDPAPTPGAAVVETGNAIIASIGGRVVDDFGTAISGALVELGSYSTYTDAQGIFRLNSISMYEQFNHVKVSSSGYVNASKICYPTVGSVVKVKITMYTNSTDGTVDNSIGGTVVRDGASLIFEAGDVSNMDGTAFTGSVNIGMHFLDPTSSEFGYNMPGDLIGFDQGQNFVGIKSFGMVYVDLSDAAGNKLKVTAGETVEVHLPVNPVVLADAPATIPMETFNETEGYWEEEGSASLVGSEYIANVAHFSWWNSGMLSPYEIFLTATIECGGVPIAHMPVEYGYVSTGASLYFYSAGVRYTDGNGVIAGWVYGNCSSFEFRLQDPCGGIAGNYPFTTTSVPLSLGTISFCPTSSTLMNVQATVVDCAMIPIPFATISYSDGASYSTLFTDASGVFNGNVLNCSGTTIDFIGMDIPNSLASNTITLAVSPTINLGNVIVCTAVVDEYFEFTYAATGVSYYASSIDPLITVEAYIFGGGSVTSIVCNDLVTGPNLRSILYPMGAGLGNFVSDTTIDGLTLRFPELQGVTQPIDSSHFFINISSFGATIGSYIEATFAGYLTTNPMAPLPPAYVTGSFRARRTN